MTATQPFKFRYLDAIIGAFALGAVTIVVIAIALIGSARQWFTVTTEVFAVSPLLPAAESEFFEDLAESIKPGVPVEMSGSQVGEVIAAEFRDGILRLRLAIANRALAQLHRGELTPEGRRGDARIVINAPFAPFMGQPTVVLKAGSAGPKGWLEDDWHRHQPITVVPPRDTAAIAKKVLMTVEQRLEPLLVAATETLTEARAALAELRAARLPEQTGALLAEVRQRRLIERLETVLLRAEAIAGSVQNLASDAQGLVRGLGEGRGTAGRVLVDERLAQDLAGIASDIKAITGELRRAAPTAPALAEGAESLLDDVQRLVDGLRRHWLLRAYLEPRAEGRLESAGIVAAPELAP
ncbi:MAG: hypothetical protein RMM29_07930 [Planctomycetota bacterium]|nr:hypothetical protein [Planctomycetota bacterium]MCX8039436.1 hypothetical protein [Planctomycetota bacterium]MDW8373555.1 hypothetical protein [Planctomycetota bacterium]